MRHATIGLLLAALSIGGAPAAVLAHSSFSDAAPIDASRTALSPGTASGLRFGDAMGFGEAMDGEALLATGVAVAVVLAIRRRRCRRLLVAALPLLLALSGFETAVHSVHHLGSSTADERCLVASSGAHTYAVGDGSPPVARFVPRVLGSVPAVSPFLCRPVVVASDSVRAPPA